MTENAQTNQTPPANPTPQAQPPVPRSSGNAMQLLIVALLIVLIGMFAYDMFVKDSETKEPATAPTPTTAAKETVTPAEETTKSPEATATAAPQNTPTTAPTATPAASASEVPAGWHPVDNASYGYTAYIPGGYYYRFFANKALLGIDENPIPEASEYTGTVTLEVRNGNLEDVKNDLISSWMAIATHEDVRKNGKWDLVKGTIPEDVMTPEMEVVAALTARNGRVYIVQYKAEPAYFAANEDLFDKFYPAIVFK